MKLHEYEGRKVVVTDTDGATFIGTATDYINSEDNEPEGESIVLETLEGALIEFRPDEINKIEIVK